MLTVIHRPWIISKDVHRDDVVQCENGHYFATLATDAVIGGDWPKLSRHGEPLDLTGQVFPIRCPECDAIAIDLPRE